MSEKLSKDKNNKNFRISLIKNLKKSPKRNIIVSSPKKSPIKSPNKSQIKTPKKNIFKSPNKNSVKSPNKSSINSPKTNFSKSSNKNNSNKLIKDLLNPISKSEKKSLIKKINISITKENISDSEREKEEKKKEEDDKLIPNTTSEVIHSFDFFKYIKKISSNYKNKKSIKDLLNKEILKYKKLSFKEIKNLTTTLLKNSRRTFIENEVIIEYLKRLIPFSNQLIEEPLIFSSISFTLKYDFQEENTILYRFHEPSDKFYIILNGSVDVIVPNDEYMDLTEEEYFCYLLNLRKFHEYDFLNKMIITNYDKFPMKEESIDIWIKRAFSTIQLVKAKKRQMERLRRLEKLKKNRDSIIENSIMNFSLVPLNEYSFLKGIKPFESEEEREFVMRIEMEIKEAFASIGEDTGILTTQFEHSKVIAKEYVERIKPIIRNYGKKVPKRRSVLITQFYIAEKLKTGNKFGEMNVDQNFNNEDNVRMETIIVYKNTEFGYLDKVDYNGILRDTYEKNREEKLKFLLDLPIFKNININLFMKNFDRYFIRKVFKYKDIIYKEGQNLNNINHFVYLVVEGNFEIKSQLSLNDIDSILLNSTLKRNINRNELDNLEKFQDYYEKKEIRFESLGKNDIIGLSDCSWNNKYFYTVICNTINAIVYSVHITYFKMMLNNDEVMNGNLKELEQIKNHILLKMLFKQRKSQVRHIKEKYIDNTLLNPIEVKEIPVNYDKVKFKNTRNYYSQIFEEKKFENQKKLPKISKEFQMISNQLISYDSNENSKNNTLRGKYNEIKKVSIDISMSDNTKPLFPNSFRYHPKTKPNLYKYSLINNSINKTNSTDIANNLTYNNTVNNFTNESSKIKSEKEYDFVSNLQKKVINNNNKFINIDYMKNENLLNNNNLNDFNKNYCITDINEGSMVNPLAYDDFNKYFNTYDYYFYPEKYQENNRKFNLMFSTLHRPIIKKKLPKDILKRKKGVLRGKLYKK